MRKALQCGRGRFDPALRQTLTPGVGGPLVYGGYDTPRISGNSDRVSVTGHPGGLYALDHLGSRPPAGPQGYTPVSGFVSRPTTTDFYGPVADLWDPAPAWGHVGGVVRRLRLLLVVPARTVDHASGIDPDDVSARLAGLSSVFDSLGLTVCLSARALARCRPLLAVVPVLTLASTKVYDSFPTGRVDRLTLTTPPTDSLPTGCDVMVVEVNRNRWSYGGMSSAVGDNATSGYTYEGFTPTTPVPGAVEYPLSGGTFSVLAFPGDMTADGAVARQLADRCDRYGHYVYQLDTHSTAGSFDDGRGSVDDAAIFAAGYGTLPFVTRRVTPAGDPDTLWARIAADAASFFG